MSEEEIIKNLEEFLKGPCEICKYCDGAIRNHRKAIQGLLDLYQKEKMNSSNLSEQLNKEKEKNKRLNEERDHIKSNLQVDLIRKGVYAQARGQIKQILDYYENNDKYLENY